MEQRFLPSGVGALEQCAKAIACLSFGQVGKRKSSLAVGVCIGVFLITTTFVVWSIVNALDLDDVTGDRFLERNLFLWAVAFTAGNCDAWSWLSLLYTPYLQRA